LILIDFEVFCIILFIMNKGEIPSGAQAKEESLVKRLTQDSSRNTSGALVSSTMLEGLGGGLIANGVDTGKPLIIAGGAVIFTAGAITTGVVGYDFHRAVNILRRIKKDRSEKS
jgi:hypothetical protein